MAKVQIKSEKITAFGGIFFVLDRFDRILSSVIDSHLGLRSKRDQGDRSLISSRWDRYLGMTAAMTQVPVSTATRSREKSGTDIYQMIIGTAPLIA